MKNNGVKHPGAIKTVYFPDEVLEYIRSMQERDSKFKLSNFVTRLVIDYMRQDPIFIKT